MASHDEESASSSSATSASSTTASSTASLSAQTAEEASAASSAAAGGGSGVARRKMAPRHDDNSESDSGSDSDSDDGGGDSGENKKAAGATATTTTTSTSGRDVEHGGDVEEIGGGGKTPGEGRYAPPRKQKSAFELSLRPKESTVYLQFRNLTYTVKTGKLPWKKRPRNLLDDVSGNVRPGQFLAIMGPSGAGKTTLLNVLAGRMAGKMSGEITLNGRPLRGKGLRRVSGYVMQDDLLLSHLTVRETFLYTAMLRLPATMPWKEKMARVNNVISELGLVKCRNTKIGNEQVRGVSGGERKRVAIGQELITDPSLLFADEPTSGMDAFTSLTIVETLRNLAHSGRTVVCTIHQPRSNIFDLFDLLLLLAGGKIVYFGPGNRAVEYFARLGHQCPTYANPADYFLDLAAEDQRTPESHEVSRARVEQLQTAYAESPEAAAVLSHRVRKGKRVRVTRGSHCLVQFCILFLRALVNFWRNYVFFIFRTVQTLIFAIVIGLIYLRIGHDQDTIQDRAGLLFFCVINQGFGSLFSVLQVFPKERLVFLRESRSNMYKGITYYISKQLAEIPASVAFPILFGTIVYWMVGLTEEAGAFFRFLTILVLMALTTESLGIALSCCIPNGEMVQLAATMIMVITMVFSGLYINADSVPPYMYWISYLSPPKYAFELAFTNEMDGQHFHCTSSQLVRGVCPVTTGEQAIRNFSFSKNNSVKNYFTLSLMIVVFRVCGYAGLHFVR